MEAERKRAELTLSDRSELRSLRDYLSWAAPEVRVLQLPGRERAVLDQLTLLGTGDDIVTVVKLLPEFLMSRRTAMSVTILVESTPVTLTGVNLDEILPPLTRLLCPPAEMPPLSEGAGLAIGHHEEPQAISDQNTRLATDLDYCVHWSPGNRSLMHTIIRLASPGPQTRRAAQSRLPGD